jgi:6-phosphogluconolactonase
MSQEIVIADLPRLGSALVNDFETEKRRAIDARGRFAVALPGGSVGMNLFTHLAGHRFDWSLTDFFWVDERAVPPSDRESNFGLALSTWLEPARVPPERLHRMKADDPDLSRSARAYADELSVLVGHPPRLDHVLLGVGADGHVASLFPGHPATANEQDLVLAVDDAPTPPRRRLTLTMPVLAGAVRLVVAAFGREKAHAIYEALRNPESSLPVAIATRRAHRPLFLLDPEAGALL